MTNFDSSFDHLNTPSFLFPSRNGQDVDIDYIDSPRGSNFKKYNEVFDSKWEAIEDIASKSNNLGKTPYKSKKNSENVEDMLNSSFQVIAIIICICISFMEHYPFDITIDFTFGCKLERISFDGFH